MRWSLRLAGDDALGALSVSAWCASPTGLARGPPRRLGGVVGGRWALAPAARGGRREPAHTLARELEEEWSVFPERLAVEALVCLPNRIGDAVGQAWLAEGRRDARPRARRTRVVAGGSRAVARRGRRDAAPDGTLLEARRELPHPQVPVLRPLGGLPVAVHVG